MAEERVKVVVTVDLERFDAVVQQAAAAGLEVEDRMTAVGVVTGRVSRDRTAALAGVDGVEAVEEERTFQLPPPDSPVQ